MMPSFLYPATPQAFIKPRALPTPSRHDAASTAAASSSSRTTLSQRFRRAVKQDDLRLAQRIAAKALDLQQQARPGYHRAIDSSAGLVSPNPPKAALRAADAQRPLSSQPFDVRNVEHADLEGKKIKPPNRTYGIGVNHEATGQETAESSLVLAVKGGADIELIRWLIEMGHELKGPSTDSYGHSVLHLAALYDRADVIYAYSTYSSVYIAVSIGDLVDDISHHDRRTALHLACIKGHEDVARQLLDLGAAIDVADREGNTALHCASAWGHLSLVQLLIERGCSFAAQNHAGFTAADFAFTHSVKAALEAFARAQFEARKRGRRNPAAGGGPSFTPSSSGMGANFRRSMDDTYSRHANKPQRTEFKPPPLPLSLSEAARSNIVYSPKPIAPHSATFAGFDGHGYTIGQEGALSDRLYDDWDPERTFAQPGQDLHASNRNGVTSPHRPLMSGAYDGHGAVRPSLDLYSEHIADMAATQHAAAAEAAVSAASSSPVPPPSREGARSTDPTRMYGSRTLHSFSPRPSLTEERRRAPSDAQRGAGRRSPLPPSSSDGMFRSNNMWQGVSQVGRRPSPSPSNGDSPSTTGRTRLGSLADQVWGKEGASGNALFRRGPSPQPPRHATPPIPSAEPRQPRDGKGRASGDREGEGGHREYGAVSPLQQTTSLSSSLPTTSALESQNRPEQLEPSKDAASSSDDKYVVQKLLDFAGLPGHARNQSPPPTTQSSGSTVMPDGGSNGSGGGRKGSSSSKGKAPVNEHEKALLNQLKVLL